jgi:tetratricopeptide (TPR) repeat protein
MNSLGVWIKNNVKEARTAEGLAAGIPFTLWQRQWEVCEVAGERARSREIAGRISALARSCPRYAVTDRLYNSQVGIFSGEYARALELAEEALEICRRGQDVSSLAEIYGQLSQAHQSLSNYEKALEFRGMAAELYRAQGDQISLGNSLANAGLIYWKMGRSQEALSHLERARRIFENNRDERSMAVVLTNTANVLLATDQTEKAQENYLAALAICRRTGDLAKQSSLHNNLGAIMFRRADYSGALRHYNLGLRIDETLGNLTGQAAKLNNMAVMLGSMGKHDEAMASFERALKIDLTTGNQDGQMRKLGNIATLHSIKGNYPKAVELIDRAIEISRKINSQGYYGYFLSQKVSYLGNLGDNAGAKVIGNEAIEVTRDSGNLSQLSTLYSNLADIYCDTGELDKAYEYSSQAIDLIKKQELFEVLKENSWYTHSMILEKMGRDQEASECLKKAYDEVRQKAGNIGDEEERKGFLTKNRAIAEIVKKWESSRPKEV